MGTEPAKDWQAVASKLQSHRDATIAALDPPLPTLPSDLPSNVTGIPKQILSESELYITELPVEELIPKLANGELKAVDVTKAYLRRAGLAGLLVYTYPLHHPQGGKNRAGIPSTGIAISAVYFTNI